MKLIKCPKCGEMYSDSYRTCPFCQEDEALKGRAAAPRRVLSACGDELFCRPCLAAAAREYTGDAWIYYGLAMAGVFMFVLDRLKKNMPPLLLYTLSWVALIFPLLLSGILAQASS